VSHGFWLKSPAHRTDLSTLWLREKFRTQNNSAALVVGSKGPLGRFLIRGEQGNDIMHELDPRPSEPIIDITGKSAFAYTDFELLLRIRGVKNLIIGGLTTDVTVMATMRDACDRGFDCLAVSDAIAASVPELEDCTHKIVTAQGGNLGAIADLQDMLKTMKSLPLTGGFNTDSEKTSAESIKGSSAPLTTQQVEGTSGASIGASGPTPELPGVSTVTSTKVAREPPQQVETNQSPQPTEPSMASGPTQVMQASQEAEPTQVTAAPTEAMGPPQAAEPTQRAAAKEPADSASQAAERTTKAPEEPTPPAQESAPATENTAQTAETIQAVEPTQATTDVTSGSTAGPKAVTFAQPNTATIETPASVQQSRISTPQPVGSSTTGTPKTSDQTSQASEENASASSMHDSSSTQASMLPAHSSTIQPSDTSAQETAELALGTETASATTQQMLKSSAEPGQNTDAPAPTTPSQLSTEPSTGSIEHGNNTATAPAATSVPILTSNEEVPAQNTASATEKPSDTHGSIMTTRTEDPDSSTTEPSSRTGVSNVESKQQGLAAAFVVPNEGLWEEYNTVKAAAAAASAAQSSTPATLDATDSAPTSAQEPSADANAGGMPGSMTLDQYGAFKASIAEAAEQEGSQTSTVPGSGASPDTNTAAPLNMSRSDQQVGQTSTETAGETIPESKQESSTAQPIADFGSYLASIQASQESVSKESGPTESASIGSVSEESSSKESSSKEPASKESALPEPASKESVLKESTLRTPDAAAMEGSGATNDPVPPAISVDQPNVASNLSAISATKKLLDVLSGSYSEKPSTGNPEFGAPIEADMLAASPSQDAAPPQASMTTAPDVTSDPAAGLGQSAGSSNIMEEQVVDIPDFGRLVTSLPSEAPTTTTLSSSEQTSSIEELPVGPSADKISKENTDNAPAAQDVAINPEAEEPIAPAVQSLDISKVMVAGYCCQQCAAEGK